MENCATMSIYSYTLMTKPWCNDSYKILNLLIPITLQKCMIHRHRNLNSLDIEGEPIFSGPGKLAIPSN